jgi:hypothetical protein
MSRTIGAGELPEHGTAFGELQGTGINIDPGLPPLGSVRDVFLQNKKWQPDIDRVSVEDAREGLRDDEGDPRPLATRGARSLEQLHPKFAPLITMSPGLIVLGQLRSAASSTCLARSSVARRREDATLIRGMKGLAAAADVEE